MLVGDGNSVSNVILFVGGFQPPTLESWMTGGNTTLFVCPLLIISYGIQINLEMVSKQRVWNKGSLCKQLHNSLTLNTLNPTNSPVVQSEAAGLQNHQEVKIGTSHWNNFTDGILSKQCIYFAFFFGFALPVIATPPFSFWKSSTSPFKVL